MPRWLLYTLLTMFLWGGWGVISKPLSDGFTAWQVQAFSTLGVLPVLAILMASSGAKDGSAPNRGFALAFVAGLITSIGNVACYQALAAGGKAAAVIPLTSLYPLVTIILALAFLRERLSSLQLLGIGVALGAIYCFNVGAETGLWTPWLLVALVPVGLWGLSAFLQKLATAHASAERATLAFLAGFIPVALVIPLFSPMSWRMSGNAWMLMLLLGLCFALGNLTLIFAYGSGGRAAIVTPMASLYALVTIPLAVLLLGESIGHREWWGITLALMAVVALSCERHNTTNSPKTSPHSPAPAP